MPVFLLSAFIAVPVIEIALFLEIGGWIASTAPSRLLYGLERRKLRIKGRPGGTRTRRWSKLRRP